MNFDEIAKVVVWDKDGNLYAEGMINKPTITIEFYSCAMTIIDKEKDILLSEKSVPYIKIKIREYFQGYKVEFK